MAQNENLESLKDDLDLYIAWAYSEYQSAEI